jgi:hypothetical protein
MAVQWLLLCVAASPHGGVNDNNGGSSCSTQQNTSAIYVYKEQRFHLRDLLDSCDPAALASQNELPTGGYTAVVDFWVDSLQSSLLRTDKPEQATFFLIPFNLDRSFYIGECGGTTHAQRINSVLDAVQDSPHFIRNGGSDHVSTRVLWCVVVL